MPSSDGYLHIERIFRPGGPLRGYEGDNGSPRTKKARNSAQNILEKVIDPRITYRVMTVLSSQDGCLSLDDGTLFMSNTLSKVFSDCSKAVCFAATIGESVDREISRLSSRGDYSMAYILDTLASDTVELVTNEFQKRMGQRFRKTGKATLRFSPGYCDWNIVEQNKLFEIIDTKRIGLTLSESCLMNPRKSISGVFGILPHSKGSTLRPYNPCKECKNKNCPGRRMHYC